MKSRKYAINLYLCLVPLMLAFAVGFSGCEEPRTIRFMAVPNGSILALSADDIVQVMSRAGFSDEQIIEFGPGLRSALLNSGACQVKQGRIVEAVFAVQGKYVHVATKMRGSFIYNTKGKGLQGEYESVERPSTGQQQPSVAPGGAPKGSAPLLETTPTGNKAPKLQFFGN